VRTALGAVTTAGVLAACASGPQAGRLDEESSRTPTITAVDTGHPPRSVTIQLDQQGYVALLLVAPGHSASLLYPRDSVVDNRLNAGSQQIAFEIPGSLVRLDSALLADRARARQRADSGRIGVRTRSRTAASLPPIDPATPTYLLLLTSPQPLSYNRIVERTVGVSIPIIDLEALNAVGKAVKGTLPAEPRDMAGYYQRVSLTADK
jgi:hypothetical protein